MLVSRGIETFLGLLNLLIQLKIQNSNDLMWPDKLSCTLSALESGNGYNFITLYTFTHL